MKITKEQFKGIVKEVMIDESEYQEFFKKALEKAGKSIPDMSDEEKKAFFNKIDAAWDTKGEKKNEGNAFGAAVSDAKEKGEDEFEVGGEKFKVESVNEAAKPTIKVVNKLKNEQGIQIVVVKTTKGETMYGGFVVRGKLQKVIPAGANNSKESVQKRALQIWDEFGKQLGENINETLLPADTKVVKSFFDKKP